MDNFYKKKLLIRPQVLRKNLMKNNALIARNFRFFIFFYSKFGNIYLSDILFSKWHKSIRHGFNISLKLLIYRRT